MNALLQAVCSLIGVIINLVISNATLLAATRNANRHLAPVVTQVPASQSEAQAPVASGPFGLTAQLRLRDVQEKAIDAMTVLEQGNMTCDEYIQVFNMHFKLSGYNEIAGLQEFKRGLSKGLRRKLLGSFLPPEDNPDGTINMGNWMNRAAELDRRYRREKRLMQWANKGSQRGQGQRNSHRTTLPVYGNRAYGYIRTYGSMDNGSRREIVTRSAPARHWDPNSMDIWRNRRSRSEITCYHCQRTGHFARDCPNKDRPRTRQSRMMEIWSIYREMTDDEREQLKKDLGF